MASITHSQQYSTLVLSLSAISSSSCYLWPLPGGQAWRRSGHVPWGYTAPPQPTTPQLRCGRSELQGGGAWLERNLSHLHRIHPSAPTTRDIRVVLWLQRREPALRRCVLVFLGLIRPPSRATADNLSCQTSPRSGRETRQTCLGNCSSLFLSISCAGRRCLPCYKRPTLDLCRATYCSTHPPN